MGGEIVAEFIEGTYLRPFALFPEFHGLADKMIDLSLNIVIGIICFILDGLLCLIDDLLEGSQSGLFKGWILESGQGVLCIGDIGL